MSSFCFTLHPFAPVKPHPEVFALMRNAHEVIRGALADLTAALAVPTPDHAAKRAAVDSFRAQWRELARFLAIHQKMEDGALKAEGVFAMLDRLGNGVAKAAGLRNAHSAVASLERAIERSFGLLGSFGRLQDAFRAFKEANEEHLKEEEQVMMPAIKTLSDAGTDMRELMRASVLAALSADERAFFVKYGVRVLEQHPEGMPRARVFVHALQAVADSADEWEKDRALVQASLSPAEYDKVSAALLDMSAFGVGAYPKGSGPAKKAGFFA